MAKHNDTSAPTEDIEQTTEASPLHHNENIQGYDNTRHNTSARHLKLLRKRLEASGDIHPNKTGNPANYKSIFKVLSASIADSAREPGFIAIGSKSLFNLEIARDDGVENGTAYDHAGNPGAKTVVALADYYGVSTDYILGMTEYDNPDVSVAELGRRLGLTNEATDHLCTICNGHLLDTFNKILSCGKLEDVLYQLKCCIELSDRLIDTATSSQKQDLSRSFELEYIQFSVLRNKFLKREFVTQYPEYKDMIDKDFAFTQDIFGSDYLEYRVQSLMHAFEAMVNKVARIEDAHNADKYNTIDREAVLEAMQAEIEEKLDDIRYPEPIESILADLEELNKDVDDGGESADCQTSDNADDSSDNP